MATKEALRKARNKYISEKLEGISFRVPKGEKAVIQAYARAKGVSVNSLIYAALKEKMEREPIEPAFERGN